MVKRLFVGLGGLVVSFLCFFLVDFILWLTSLSLEEFKAPFAHWLAGQRWM